MYGEIGSAEFIKYKNLVDIKSSFRRTAGPLEAPVFFKVIYGQVERERRGTSDCVQPLPLWPTTTIFSELISAFSF